MADFAKCLNGCENKNTCLRWTTPMGALQQWMADFKPDNEGKCKHYLEEENAK